MIILYCSKIEAKIDFEFYPCEDTFDGLHKIQWVFLKDIRQLTKLISRTLIYTHM